MNTRGNVELAGCPAGQFLKGDEMIKRRKGIAFKPSQEFLDEAVRDFLNKGGKIEKIEFSKKNTDTFLSAKTSRKEVDNFLLGD